jgi:Helix-turn-helix
MSNADVDLPFPPVPTVWEPTEARGAIASRNWGAVFAILRRYGYSQEQISAMTGCSTSEVAAIIGGRPLFSYETQLRVARALGVPMCLAGFAVCAAACGVPGLQRRLAG